MKKGMRMWRKIAMWSARGFLMALAVLCLVAGGAHAASARAAYANKHAVRKTRNAVRMAASKAMLRHAAYKTPTHKRRRRRTRHHVILPKAPSAARTEEIQSALERGGFYSGDPSGKWDSNTQESLRRFQEAKGLPPTGKLDALSLQKMGLGSDVAGVSAPRQITPGNPSTSPAATTAVPKTPGL
jgi:hypothetical protein